MIARRTAVLATAIALDLTFGEPPDSLHPVVWIGRAIARLERSAPHDDPALELLYGGGMVASVVGAAGIVAALAERLPDPLGFVVETSALSTLFAVRGLLRAAGRVREPLVRGDLDAARDALSWLVSRDVRGLGPPLIAAAAIESVAENLTDSALAPWLAYALGGLPGAAAYRALNTLDSMIGYRGRYEHLGKAAARLDDMANLLGARLGAMLIAAGATVAGGSGRGAWRTATRHHARTASPNAGWTMAAMAGALGVKLEKLGAYRLGTGRLPRAADIRRATRIACVALAGGALLSLVLTESLARRATHGTGARRHPA